MKTIIAGSRGINQGVFLLESLKTFPIEITEVVSGMCKNSPDMLGYYWAYENNIPVAEFHPNWRRYNKAAGMFRNWDMGEYADAALIIWDGESKGSAQMAQVMKKLGKPYSVVTVVQSKVDVLKYV